jgi:hypothetical protein
LCLHRTSDTTNTDQRLFAAFSESVAAEPGRRLLAKPPHFD